jgi:hypothetical protein
MRHLRSMKRFLALMIVLSFCAIEVHAQVPPKGSGEAAAEVVDELWHTATEGELLRAEGWDRASRYFVRADPFPGNSVILVMSNYWGPPAELKMKDNAAEVTVGFADAGRIDSSLRYTPPRDSGVVKTVMLYRLLFAPIYGKMPVIGPDGKMTGEMDTTHPAEWRIEGPQGLPWTTVNTAIRYVLEMQKRTTNPVIKRNADQTLASLLRLQ